MSRVVSGPIFDRKDQTDYRNGVNSVVRTLMIKKCQGRIAELVELSFCICVIMGHINSNSYNSYW